MRGDGTVLAVGVAALLAGAAAVAGLAAVGAVAVRRGSASSAPLHLSAPERLTWSVHRRRLLSGEEVSVEILGGGYRWGGVTAIEWEVDPTLLNILEAGDAPQWVVSGSGIDSRLKGRGIGSELYERLLEELSVKGDVIVSNDAAGGRGTSQQALRVWASLCKRLRCAKKGSMVAVLVPSGWQRRGGSRSQARIHAMKLPGWTTRLESGTRELAAAGAT
jgi:ribosomal protein S18 acetylase RimI-like enzyme